MRYQCARIFCGSCTKRYEARRAPRRTRGQNDAISIYRKYWGRKDLQAQVGGNSMLEVWVVD